MSYAGYGQSPYVQEPKVRIEAISEAWALVREKIGVWIPVTLILGGGSVLISYLINSLIGLIFGVGRSAPPPTNPGAILTPMFFVANIIASVISLVISAFVSCSFFRLALKQVRGENIELSEAFKFDGNIAGVIVTNLLVGVLTVIGGILCYIPGVIAAIGTIFAVPLAIDRGLNGIDPISKSWEKMKGQLGNGFLLLLVLGLIVLVSVIPLGLGLLVTVPLYILTIAILYRDFFDVEGVLRGPSLNMPLPPSSAYGAGQPAPGRFGDVPPVPYGQTPGDVPPPAPGTTPPPPGQTPPSTPGQMGSIQM